MLKWEDVLKMSSGGTEPPEKKVVKSEEEWRDILDTEVFRITRKKGTEFPFSSALCSQFGPGKYACACCGTLLFDAQEKFESGTGWPSFTQPVSDNAIAYHSDRSHGMHRVETVCPVCDAHLGHVFPDGPPPSGLRFCINALALRKLE
jgi:methionine-R-sulfoxide reductase